MTGSASASAASDGASSAQIHQCFEPGVAQLRYSRQPPPTRTSAGRSSDSAPKRSLPSVMPPTTTSPPRRSASRSRYASTISPSASNAADGAPAQQPKPAPGAGTATLTRPVPGSGATQATATATSASTTSGSNCVPALLRSSATATSWLIALR